MCPPEITKADCLYLTCTQSIYGRALVVIIAMSWGTSSRQLHLQLQQPTSHPVGLQWEIRRKEGASQARYPVLYTSLAREPGLSITLPGSEAKSSTGPRYLHYAPNITSQVLLQYHRYILEKYIIQTVMSSLLYCSSKYILQKT